MGAFATLSLLNRNKAQLFAPRSLNEQSPTFAAML
jgi:hypothetical protein